MGSASRSGLDVASEAGGVLTHRGLQSGLRCSLTWPYCADTCPANGLVASAREAGALCDAATYRPWNARTPRPRLTAMVVAGMATSAAPWGRPKPSECGRKGLGHEATVHGLNPRKSRANPCNPARCRREGTRC